MRQNWIMYLFQHCYASLRLLGTYLISSFRMNRRTYIHCNRCCAEASPSCLKHKQLIEIFYGTEIDKLRRRRQYECKFCFKIGYSDSERITCRFCRSRNIKVLNWNIPNKCAWLNSSLYWFYNSVIFIRIWTELNVPV